MLVMAPGYIALTLTEIANICYTFVVGWADKRVHRSLSIFLHAR